MVAKPFRDITYLFYPLFLQTVKTKQNTVLQRIGYFDCQISPVEPKGLLRVLQK